MIVCSLRMKGTRGVQLVSLFARFEPTQTGTRIHVQGSRSTYMYCSYLSSSYCDDNFLVPAFAGQVIACLSQWNHVVMQWDAMSFIWNIRWIHLFCCFLCVLRFASSVVVDLSQNETNDDGININIGVLLPMNDVPLSKEPCFSIKHLLSTSKLAIKGALQVFPSTTIDRVRVWFIDSNCSDTVGPLNAMKLLLNMEVHAFFGPCCKYVLSPVARYARVWGTPIITPGGLTPAFSNKRSFPLLTRIMAPYDKLASFLVLLMEYYEWTYYSLLWHDHHLRKWMGKSECMQMADALIRVTSSHKRLHDPHKETFDEGYINSFDWKRMLGGIKNNSRGKWNFLVCFWFECSGTKVRFEDLLLHCMWSFHLPETCIVPLCGDSSSHSALCRALE